MKIAMLFGVASALGQLKWSWYKEHRYLADLEIIGGVNGLVLGVLKVAKNLQSEVCPTSCVFMRANELTVLQGSCIVWSCPHHLGSCH